MRIGSSRGQYHSEVRDNEYRRLQYLGILKFPLTVWCLYKAFQWDWFPDEQTRRREIIKSKLEHAFLFRLLSRMDWCRYVSTKVWGRNKRWCRWSFYFHPWQTQCHQCPGQYRSPSHISLCFVKTSRRLIPFFTYIMRVGPLLQSKWCASYIQIVSTLCHKAKELFEIHALLRQAVEKWISCHDLDHDMRINNQESCI